MKACAAPTTTPKTSCAPRCSPIPPSPAATPATTPLACCMSTMVPGSKVSVDVAAKGGGSENKSQVQDDEPQRFDRRLGGGNAAPDGRGLVPAGHARASASAARRNTACCSPSRALMEPIDMGQLKARGAAERYRGAAHRDFRQGQRARHRRAGAGRAFDHPRRQDPRLAVPCRGQAGGDDPQLRRHPPRAFHARRFGPELSSKRPSSMNGPRSNGRPTRRQSASISIR